MVSFKEAEDIALRENCITEEFLDKLVECSEYGSMGTLNTVIRILSILKERVEAGQKIKYEKTNIFFDLDSLKSIISDKFGEYISKGVFQKTKYQNKAYFKLENTEEGMDLIFTGNQENNLFEFIANINEDESLVRIIPTNVVYIKNRKNNTYAPFLTEHNSCYYYDEEDGKIKEYFGK